MKDKNNRRKLNLKLPAGLLISALFLSAAFFRIDMTRILEILGRTNAVYLFLAILVVLTQYLIRAWRWRILLITIKDTGFLNRLLSLLTGFAANCVFPARLGEFIRANYLGRAERISGSATFGTVVIERIFDGFCLILILVIGIMTTRFPDEYKSIAFTLRGAAFSVFITYILIIGFIIGFRYKTDLFIEGFGRVLFFLSSGIKEKGIGIIRNLSLGLAPLKGFYSWAMAIFYSVLIWFIALYQIQFIECSTGIELPFEASFFIQAMAFLGVSIPLAPGFIGPFHLAVQYGFIFYGVPREEALSAAILLHGSFYFPTIILGVLSFIRLQTMHFNPEASDGRKKEGALHE